MQPVLTDNAFADQDAAMSWYDREYPNLVEAFTLESDPHLSRLPSVMRPYFFRRAASGKPMPPV